MPGMVEEWGGNNMHIAFVLHMYNVCTCRCYRCDLVTPGLFRPFLTYRDLDCVLH